LSLQIKLQFEFSSNEKFNSIEKLLLRFQPEYGNLLPETVEFCSRNPLEQVVGKTKILELMKFYFAVLFFGDCESRRYMNILTNSEATSLHMSDRVESNRKVSNIVVLSKVFTPTRKTLDF